MAGQTWPVSHCRVFWTAYLISARVCDWGFLTGLNGLGGWKRGGRILPQVCQMLLGSTTRVTPPPPHAPINANMPSLPVTANISDREREECKANHTNHKGHTLSIPSAGHFSCSCYLKRRHSDSLLRTAEERTDRGI